jgi:hypothetical protein
MLTGIKASRYFSVDDSLPASVTRSVPHKIASRYHSQDPLTMFLPRSPSAIHREIPSHDRDIQRFLPPPREMADFELHVSWWSSPYGLGAAMLAGKGRSTDLAGRGRATDSEPQVWSGEGTYGFGPEIVGEKGKNLPIWSGTRGWGNGRGKFRL